MTEVNKPSLTYTAMSEMWAMPRALMKGTTGMRAAGESYLPKEPAESDAAYQNRLKRSTLFNAFKRTVKAVTSKVFSKEISIDVGNAEQIKKLTDDVDLLGNNLNVFAAAVFADAMQVGLSHILIDMPAGKAPKTKADEKVSNHRPYFVHIKAEDLIGWRSEKINGKEELTQIRLRETAIKQDGEFGEKEVERIRVITPDSFEVHEKQKNNNKDEWVVVEKGDITLGKIPLATFYANRTGFLTGEPPLEDLAFLNVSHWQSSSDQRNILHVARVPLLFGRMLKSYDEAGKEEELKISANSMIVSDHEQSDLKYVEHNGTGIGAGRQDLVDLIDQMRILGLELFMPKTGNQTATGKAIDSAEQNSIVKMMALQLQDTLIRALGFASDWLKITDDIIITVNTDYGVSLGNVQELTLLLNAHLSGSISQETLWSELMRRNILVDSFDFEAETERLSNETAALGLIDAENNQ